MDWEEPQIPTAILDKYTKVCTCRSISRATIKKAITDGADTVLKIKEATGACTGACKGRNCAPKIAALLKDTKKDG